MKMGVIGLPNVGKSTLFNAITGAGAVSANYPFCTIEPNVGMVSVPDRRLDWLAEKYQPNKFTPATIELRDIAGLVRGASKGEGLGNKFLADIREADALIHVVRCFEDGEVVHVDGSIGPRRDIEAVNLELIFSDIDLLDRRIDKARKAAKGDKKYEREAQALERLKTWLEEGNSARGFDAADEEQEWISPLPLLSSKPIIYAANLNEKEFTEGLEDNPFLAEVREVAAAEKAEVLPICAKLEEELSGMEPEDKLMFLSELGLEQSGLDRLITKSYSLLGLISFLTAGKDEVRAWTITNGTKAPQAAGKIHTDFERGFIRAEVVAFRDLEACGEMNAAREKGLVRSEGKEYVMQDGDVVLFRFNV